MFLFVLLILQRTHTAKNAGAEAVAS